MICIYSLRLLVGVVDHGIFAGMTHAVIVAGKTGGKWMCLVRLYCEYA